MWRRVGVMCHLLLCVIHMHMLSSCSPVYVLCVYVRIYISAVFHEIHKGERTTYVACK